MDHYWENREDKLQQQDGKSLGTTQMSGVGGDQQQQQEENQEPLESLFQEGDGTVC